MLSGNDTYSRLSHVANASSPITVTPSGIVISLKSQPLNASTPILLSIRGNNIDFRA